jgi:hypothetical protein
MRFWAKVDRTNTTGCWPWLASVTTRRGGYGQFRVGRKTRRAHVVAYELGVGPVPAGKVLDHLCRNPACVNPAHLEPVEHGENTRRGNGPSAIAFRANRCLRGHPRSPENTYVKPNGKRECRVCARSAQQRRRELRRAA